MPGRTWLPSDPDAHTEGVIQMQDYSGYGQPPTGDYFGSTSSSHASPPAQAPYRPAELPGRRAGGGRAGGGHGGGHLSPGGELLGGGAAAEQQRDRARPAAQHRGTRAEQRGSGATGSLSSVEQGLVIINTTLQYSSEQAAGTGMVINAVTAWC